MTLEQMYETHIKTLSLDEQLRLVAIITQSLVGKIQPPSLELNEVRGSEIKHNEIETDEMTAKPRHSIMELHGLGAEIWAGIDAQAYVDELRSEWEQTRN